MLVRVKKGQLNYFRRLAINNKYEVCALLLGRHTKKVAEVHRIIYPEVTEATRKYVYIDPKAYEAAVVMAALGNCEVLGTIHSHPDSPPEMSKADYQNHLECKDIVSGIVEVSADRKTRVAFWTANSSLQCEYEYY